MSVYRALHLSDLHIGGTYLNSQDLAYRIATDVARNGIGNFQKVLVTGDIFHGPAGEGRPLILEAANFFRTLMAELNQDNAAAKLTEEDFLFVPGNHDIVWTEDETARWKKYRGFLKEFYGSVPAWYDMEDFSFCCPCPEDKLVFLGFNSCGLEKRKMGELDGYRAVVMFHHHFFLFPDNPNQLGDADVVRHHATVVRDLRSMRVKTILHGHKHFDLERPFINDDYYETTDSIIDVFAGGSVGAEGLQQHAFSVIDFYPEHDAVKLKQQKFIYREDALAPIKTIQIPPASKAAQVIRLSELLKNRSYDAYEAYQAAIMSNAHLYQTCRNIIEWTGNALTGYSETYRCLDRNDRHLYCLLYAVARRAAAYVSQHSPGGGSSLAAVKAGLDAFFERWVAPCVPERYEELFEAPGLNQAARLCAELMDKQGSYPLKQHLAFTMVGIFFADLNLTLTEYADHFYRQISHKVNIKLEPNHFHAHVPAPRIGIQSDADRRSAYVKMWCDDATAHKVAVLIVKEFALSINKLEDFFKLIGLKLYYLLPQIEKNAALDALDNYNFEAYIPTLLPLLIGDNIYHSKEVFARELVQNSIDALSVREALEGRLSEEDRVIRIFLGKDQNGRDIFRIADRGTGMDRYKVERYFTSIGRSFYTGADYDELNIGYKPISSFGIGFLSSFMVCKEVDVRTRSFDGEKEGLKLHIPNYEGCFFIERAEVPEVGTEITLYLNSKETDAKKIVDYLTRSICNIRYRLEVCEIEGRKAKRRVVRCIPAYQRFQDAVKGSPCFFVPFQEDGTVGSLEWRGGEGSDRFFQENSYGLLIVLNGLEIKERDGILNAGITTRFGDMPIRELLGDEAARFMRPRADNEWQYMNEPPLCSFIFNFPSNWVQLDVSRENVVGFSVWMEARHQESGARPYFKTALASSLRAQLTGFLLSCKRRETDVPVACITETFEFLTSLAQNPNGDMLRWMNAYTYVSRIVLTDRGIDFEIRRGKEWENRELRNGTGFGGVTSKKFSGVP